ncbi:flippase [Oceanicoccus sp. KOV_DT_Chl]|uniref:flippase n=1 Tax=Oceanicoccus sp. KOV_DT_Chl TaxID=1904639 RepID=UPI000C7E5326|nr:flippase [Oceanicoccus sp. KOV_DT_Chl]
MKIERIRPYLNNTLWLLAEKVARITIGIFLFAYIARYLGPEKFGLLNFAVVLVAVTEPLIALGLNRMLVRDLVRFPEKRDEIIASVFVCKLFVAVVCFLLLLVVSLVLGVGPPEARLLIVVLAIGSLFRAFDVIEFFFQSQVAAKYSTIYKSIAFVTASAVNLVLVFLEADLLYFAAVISGELMLVGLFALIAYRHAHHKLLFGQFSVAASKKMIAECWPEVVAGVGTMLCMRLDQLMLEEMVGIKAVGVFATAARLSDAWYFIPAAIVSTTFPAIIAVRATSEHDYMQSLQNLFLILAAMSYAIVLPTMLLAPVLIETLFGEQYVEAASILMIYIWCLPAVAIGLCSGSWIFAEGKIILSLYRMLLGTVCNVLLNLVLIPLYGGIGAAMATVISLFVAFYLFDLFNAAMRPLFFMKTRALFLQGLIGYLKSYLPKAP